MKYTNPKYKILRALINSYTFVNSTPTVTKHYSYPQEVSQALLNL